MNTVLRKFYAALLLCAALSLPTFSHAAIIHYEVTGSMWFADTDWSKFTISPLVGDLYVSDVDTNPDRWYAWFDIVEFSLFAEGFDQVVFNETGTGVIYQSDDYWISLASSDWQYSSALVSYYGVLLETVSWPGQGWIFGPEYFYKVQGLSIQAVGAVPVPAAAWLFGSGLLGLVATARRKRV